MKHITENIKFYKNNNNVFGEGSPKNLWKRPECQIRRFEKFTNILDFKDKSILDVGCGYGDFYFWLINKGMKPKSYIGIDLISEHCKVARKNLPSNCAVIEGDFLQIPIPEADFSILSGALNVYYKGWLKKTLSILDKMWELSSQGIMFNIRSPHGFEGDYEGIERQKRDSRPEYWCKYANSKTCRYGLYHDYMHYDYTLALWKAEIGWQENQ